MPRVSAAFFTMGVIYVMIGMTAGIIMGAHEDFTLGPAHAHLNLLGWVTSALYGTFYALTRDTLRPKLAWTHFAVSTAGVLLMVPSLALALTGHAAFGPIIGIGGVISLLGLLLFGVSVVRELLRKRV